MMAEKTATQKEHRLFSVDVLLRSGKRLNCRVVIVEGYSTDADIQKIVRIMYPSAVVEQATLISTKSVRSFR